MKIFFSMLGLVFGLSGCMNSEPDTMVMFMEQEQGVEPYPTRMIITKKFVRVDDGEGSKKFILFDRLKNVVYSINPEEESVMEVHKKNIKAEPPFKLEYVTQSMPPLKDAPEINGEKAKHFKLLTNKESCYEVIAVDGLLPYVVNALREFHTHMATDSAATFNNIPADMHNACDMSMSTFAATRHLQYGFPIQEMGKREYMRMLVDYKQDFKADKSLFMLPEKYQRYTVQDLREGKVKLNQ